MRRPVTVDSLAVTEFDRSVKLNTTSDAPKEEPPPWRPGRWSGACSVAVAVVVAVLLFLIGIAVL